MKLAHRIAREIVGAPASPPPFRLAVHGQEVVVDAGVYERIAGRRARVALLARAAALAPRVVVHVEPRPTARHLVRAALDGPRRVLRRLAVLPEPGDRFPDEGYVHLFVDDEELLDEAAAAGLRFVARDGARLVLERGSDAEDAKAFAVEVLRVLRVFPRIVALVRSATPDVMVRTARDLGRHAERRGPVGRARLHRAISWVDAMTPPAPSCLRRVLVESALDGHAARETLVFGLDVGRTGHVAFAGREVLRFDVAFEVPPT